MNFKCGARSLVIAYYFRVINFTTSYYETSCYIWLSNFIQSNHKNKQANKLCFSSFLLLLLFLFLGVVFSLVYSKHIIWLENKCKSDVLNFHIFIRKKLMLLSVMRNHTWNNQKLSLPLSWFMYTVENSYPLSHRKSIHRKHIS